MTREEEIEKSLNFNAPSFWSDTAEVMSDRELTASYCGFRKGAQWADLHPKSPWVNVEKDLPSFHSDLVENAIATKNVIVLLNDGRIRETQLLCGHWKEYDKKVTHWMPILEPPKE